MTQLPQSAFAASDVVTLYLHRGAFETALSDEDQEQDPARWVSHTAPGQECWQIISQWLWNLRLESGHQLHPDPVRTTEFAPALPSAHKEAPTQALVQGYGPAEVALPWKAGRFSGQDFALQPDGTLRCPASQSLVAHEQHREADSSLRVVYAASIHSCRPGPLREQCQWNGLERLESTATSTCLLEALYSALRQARCPLRGSGEQISEAVISPVRVAVGSDELEELDRPWKIKG
ncbi:hypothetical protein [Ktedonobacter robiniae]|uniref:hypothetical protein n=1 Tax=Ktedonobacter robiniae TaxID=2778365 RepID=UPI001F22BFC1|nr:hypothetical protein [Ktedonobacter robiniae]